MILLCNLHANSRLIKSREDMVPAGGIEPTA